MHIAFVVQESQGLQDISGTVLDHPHGAALVAGVQQQLGHADVQQLQQQTAGRAIGRVVVGEHAVERHCNETQGQALVTIPSLLTTTPGAAPVLCNICVMLREPGRKTQGKTSHVTPRALEHRLASQHSPGSAEVTGLSAPAQDTLWDMDKHIPEGKLDTVSLFRDLSIPSRD